VHPVQALFGLGCLVTLALNGWAWSRDRASYADAFGAAFLMMSIWVSANVLYAVAGFTEGSRVYPLLYALASLVTLHSCLHDWRSLWKGGLLLCFLLATGLSLGFWSLTPPPDPLSYWTIDNVIFAFAVLFTAFPGGGRLAGSVVPGLLRRVRLGFQRLVGS